MEFTREIYWNVGHGPATLVPMYLLVTVAIGLLVYGFLQRVKIYKIAKPLNRFDNRTARLVEAV
ncbi:MAG: hypothetical protein JRC87_12420, partial [Deltaproteobacteria bacterium]|nr:hypothetical protein [Deltaproteobacteria bacterium]